jgi:hypothetical protein
MHAQCGHKIAQMKLEQNLGLVSELLRLHSSSAKTRLRSPWRLSIQSLRLTTGRAPTSAAVGAERG